MNTLVGDTFTPSPQHPSFCFIAPTAYLDKYASQSFTHLALAHLADDPQYVSFYRKRSEMGDFIILDNSGYEKLGGFDHNALIDIATTIGAHAIVLPDYPFQSASRTIEAAVKYIPVFKDAGFKTMFVPQSEHGQLDDWILAYDWAVSRSDVDIIGMSILGIPNALPWCDPSYARVVMTAMLQQLSKFNFDKHHHYLGLNSGPALEIPSLINMNALTTIDSSNPVWMGILGHEYTLNSDSYLQVKKINMPVVFDYPLSRDPATHARIQHNIDMTNQLFGQKDRSRVWYAQE